MQEMPTPMGAAALCFVGVWIPPRWWSRGSRVDWQMVECGDIERD